MGGFRASCPLAGFYISSGSSILCTLTSGNRIRLMRCALG